MDLFGSRKAEPTPVHENLIFHKQNNARARNVENAKFCVDFLLSSTSVYFPALPGPLAALSCPDMTRRALSLQSNTEPGVILLLIARHGIDRVWVLTFVFFRNMFNRFNNPYFLPVENAWVVPLVDEISKID